MYGCVRGPYPHDSLARQFTTCCLLGNCNLLVAQLHRSAMMTKPRQGFSDIWALSPVGCGNAVSPGLSLLSSVLIEHNLRHGLNGAGCPPCTFSFLDFAAQLPSQTSGQVSHPVPLCSASTPPDSPACFVPALLLIYCPLIF